MSVTVIAWLLSALSWLRKAASAALSWVAAYPWQALSALLALLSVLLWRGEHRALDRYATSQRDLQTLRNTQKTAARAAEAQREADQRHYQELAHDADTRYRLQTVGNRTATAAFIRAHRLPPDTEGSTGPAGRAAEGGSAVLPANAPAEAELVAVTANDVTTCAADYGYARAAYEWAASLTK